MTSSTIEKIQSFGNFTQGWSFGEGVPFAPSILLKAMQLIKTAHALGFAETDAFPGLNGEVMVTIYLGQDYWEFTFDLDETITFAYEKNEETIIYSTDFIHCQQDESKLFSGNLSKPLCPLVVIKPTNQFNRRSIAA